MQTYGRALASYERVLGEYNAHTLMTLNNLASALKNLSRVAEAEKHFRDLLARRRAAGRYEHHETAIALGNLGVCLEALDRLDEAESNFDECFVLLKKCHIPDRHWITATFRKGLGVVRVKQRRFAEAETILKGSLATFESAKGDHQYRIERTLEALLTLYEAWGKPAQAEEVRRRLVDR